MECKFTNDLNPESKTIRQKVFVDEQGYSNEFDDIDRRALHVVVYDNNKPAATGRLFSENGDKKAMTIGRVAVLKEYRKSGLGRIVINRLEEQALSLGAEKIELLAQLTAKGFYEKLGYTETEINLEDEGFPHVKMVKNLK